MESFGLAPGSSATLTLFKLVVTIRGISDFRPSPSRSFLSGSYFTADTRLRGVRLSGSPTPMHVH
jgi:hypothetical protein